MSDSVYQENKSTRYVNAKDGTWAHYFMEKWEAAQAQKAADFKGICTHCGTGPCNHKSPFQVIESQS